MTQILKKYSRYALFLLVVLFAASLTRNIVKIKGASQKIDDKVQAVADLESMNNKLQKELELVESDAFVERQLRDKLGLAKEGEIVIVLPEEELLREIGKLKEEEVISLPDPNWVRWAKLFGINI